MNNCLNCREPVNNKYCNVSCQNKHQGSERANKKYGAIKDFEVSCKSCENKFLIQEREKLFPKKERYFCSISCANTKKHTKKTKEKIKNSLLNHNEKKLKFVKNLTCVVCKVDFNSERQKKTCSKECNIKLHKLNGSLGGQKSSFNKKQYDGNMITYIYAMTDEFGNIRYVGKSNDLKTRYKYHLKESKNKRTHKEKWINSMLEKNIKPDCFILEECIFSDWIFMEEYWIAQIKSWGFNLTNGTNGGEGSNGFKGKTHSEETKQKLRDKTLYNNKNGLVKPYTINYENNKNIKLTNEDVMNIRNSYNGKNTKELASKYNIVPHYVREIINNKKRIQ